MQDQVTPSTYCVSLMAFSGPVTEINKQMIDLFIYWHVCKICPGALSTGENGTTKTCPSGPSHRLPGPASPDQRPSSSDTWRVCLNLVQCCCTNDAERQQLRCSMVVWHHALESTTRWDTWVLEWISRRTYNLHVVPLYCSCATRCNRINRMNSHSRVHCGVCLYCVFVCVFWCVHKGFGAEYIYIFIRSSSHSIVKQKKETIMKAQ